MCVANHFHPSKPLRRVPLWVVWVVALIAVPAVFVAALLLGIRRYYLDSWPELVSGVIAYAWMVEAVALACRPHWLDRLIGLPAMYQLHGVMSSLALVVAYLHTLLSPSFGDVELTGRIGLYVLLSVVVLALVFMAGYFNTLVPATGWVRRLLEYAVKHETSVWLHRLALVSAGFAWRHFHLIGYIADAIVFIWMVDVCSAVVLVWYLSCKLWLRFGSPTGVVIKVCHPSADIVELVVRAPRLADRWREGDYVFLRFPGRKGMHEFHPFSISNSPNGDGDLRFAIRGDGDFTRLAQYTAVGDGVALTTPFGRYRRFIDEHPNDVPVTIYAGGIGVTPLVPIAKALIRQGRRVTFLYSIHLEGTALYYDELADLAAQGMVLRFARGHFPDVQLHKAAAPGSVVLIGGPTSMLRHVTRLLRQDGIPAKDIASEPFVW